MRVFHYTTAAGAGKIQRLGRGRGWEFKETEQNQSEGKPKAAYLSQRSPQDIAQVDRPVARYLGLSAQQGDVWICFEMDVPDAWAGTDPNQPLRIRPIRGGRGQEGIALYMKKTQAYHEYAGDNNRDEYIFILPEYCRHMWSISTKTGKGKEVKEL